jgi:hypothetical protein
VPVARRALTGAVIALSKLTEWLYEAFVCNGVPVQ